MFRFVLCHSLLSLFLTPALTLLSAAESKVVIWKIDDVRAGEKARLSPGFKRIGDWSEQQKIPVTMGVICNALTNPNAEDVTWIKKHAVENGGLIEFWLHGLDHQSNTLPDGQKTYEFKGTPLKFQSEHLKQACDLFAKTTGLTFRTFGAPYNQIDEQTPDALDQTPNLTIWFYGPNQDKRRQVLTRTLNLEIATGKISAETFLASYHKKPATSPLVLQGHGAQWDEASYRDFLQIADFLKKEGWQAMTATQYVNSLHPRAASK
jgi:hypothetical protein